MNNFTLSDSFLEKAMVNHMGDGNMEYEASHSVSKKRPTLVDTTISTPDTPKSNKSTRLTRRRQEQRLRRLNNRISPGLLILSDSDSFQDSPPRDRNCLHQGSTAGGDY